MQAYIYVCGMDANRSIDAQIASKEDCVNTNRIHADDIVHQYLYTIILIVYTKLFWMGGVVVGVIVMVIRMANEEW